MGVGLTQSSLESKRWVQILALPPAGWLRQLLSSLCLNAVMCKEGGCNGVLSLEPHTR